MGDLVD